MHVAFLIESIPELPDGRGSLFDGMEPGGRRLLLEQGISDIQGALVTEHMQEKRS